MVGNILMCKCTKCGPNFTHSNRKHRDWIEGKYTMPATHPLHKFNKELGKTVPTQPLPILPPPTTQPSEGSTSPGSTTQGTVATGDSLTFSRSGLEAKIAPFEYMSIDLNSSLVIDAICQLLLN